MLLAEVGDPITTASRAEGVEAKHPRPVAESVDPGWEEPCKNSKKSMWITSSDETLEPGQVELCAGTTGSKCARSSNDVKLPRRVQLKIKGELPKVFRLRSGNINSAFAKSRIKSAKSKRTGDLKDMSESKKTVSKGGIDDSGREELKIKKKNPRRALLRSGMKDPGCAKSVMNISKPHRKTAY